MALPPRGWQKSQAEPHVPERLWKPSDQYKGWAGGGSREVPQWMKPQTVHLKFHRGHALLQLWVEPLHCQSLLVWGALVFTGWNLTEQSFWYTLLPRPCPPQGCSLWHGGWWLTGFYTNTGQENPRMCLYNEGVSRFPGWPQGALAWTGAQSGESRLNGTDPAMPQLNTQNPPHFKKDGKFILPVWKCCLYEKRFSMELKWFASGHDLSLCLQRTSQQQRHMLKTCWHGISLNEYIFSGSMKAFAYNVFNILYCWQGYPKKKERKLIS